MIKIGNLYGCDLYLDTEDQKVADEAVHFLEHREWQAEELQKLITEQELNLH